MYVEKFKNFNKSKKKLQNFINIEKCCKILKNSVNAAKFEKCCKMLQGQKTLQKSKCYEIR